MLCEFLSVSCQLVIVLIREHRVQHALHFAAIVNPKWRQSCGLLHGSVMRDGDVRQDLIPRSVLYVDVQCNNVCEHLIQWLGKPNGSRMVRGCLSVSGVA